MFGAQQYAKMAARMKDTSTQLSDSSDDSKEPLTSQPIIQLDNSVAKYKNKVTPKPLSQSPVHPRWDR